MTLTMHTAIGAVIGITVGNPYIGLALGFISHFLVDMIPHGDSKIAISWNESKKKKWPIAYASIDTIVAAYLILALTNIVPSEQMFTFTLAIAGSILPDLLIAIHDITRFPILKKFKKIHFYFHDFFTKKHGDIQLTYAVTGQLLVIIFLLLPILYN